MFAELQVKVRGKIQKDKTLSSDKEKDALVQEVLSAFQISRTHCTSLSEFHLFWHYTFKTWASRGQADLVNYLRSTYFFELPASVAKEQYQLEELTCSDNTRVICAAFWGSYARCQPGSASGTQSLEAQHLPCFRSGIVDDRGRLQHRLPPCEFFKRMAQVLILQGRLLRKMNTKLFADRPMGRDPTSCSSNKLSLIGRSTAAELHDHKDAIRSIGLLGGRSIAYVLPRTLKTWSKEDKKWVDSSPNSWELSVERACRIARLATTNNCRQLEALWRESNILQGRAGNLKIDFQKWCELRYKYVVVLTGEAAASYWHVSRSDLYVCACTYFNVSGRCEHEQCVHCMRNTGGISPDTVGLQPPRGRPATMVAPIAEQVSSCNRGLPSSAIMSKRAAAENKAEEKCAKMARAVARVPQPPQQHELIHSGPSTSSTSDAMAVPCAPLLQVDTSSTGSRSDTARARGTNVGGTNFELVSQAIQPNVMPAACNIYFNTTSAATQMHLLRSPPACMSDFNLGHMLIQKMKAIVELTVRAAVKSQHSARRSTFTASQGLGRILRWPSRQRQHCQHEEVCVRS